MLQNHFLTAWRNIRRNHFYSLLNIAGLAIGLAVGILILLWVKDELSFDSFHKQADHVYRINSHLGTGADAHVWTEAPGPLAVFARHSIPEVAKAVRVINRGNKYLVTYGATTFLESNTVCADPDFFTVFDFPLLNGNRAHPFTDDHSIVITKSMAEKYFGNADPMGKVLVFDKKDNFTVTGVLADFPANSSIHYDIILPMDRLARIFSAGGDIKPGSPADSTHYILNEAAVKAMGMKNPVGKVFVLHDIRGTIIGVVKDFNYASLKGEVHPLILTYDSAATVLYVRTRPGQATESVAAVRHFWQQYDGAYPFSYSFLDDDFDKMYRSDQRVGTLFNVFALVTIVISCLGLFGLATYSAQTRTKEIGIRRVLGASITHVTGLLVKDFVALIALAFVIAAPIAGYLMSGWLHNYAYRTQLTVGIFAGTAFIILALALIAVCTQAIRAACVNPVKSLRTD
jgi:ABC-type antimicrobial peptide transport system permease subunit